MVSIVPSSKNTNWYDPRIQVNDPVVFQNVNLANGTARSVTVNMIRFEQDMHRRFLSNAVREGFAVSVSSPNVQVSPGEAIVAGRWVSNDSTVTIDLSTYADGDYYVVISVGSINEGEDRDVLAENASIEVVNASGFSVSDTKIVLAKVSVSSGTVTLTDNYSGGGTVSAARIIPPVLSDGSSYSGIEFFVRSGAELRKELSLSWNNFKVIHGQVELGWLNSDEGGQITFSPNGTYTKSIYIDRYKNWLRVNVVGDGPLMYFMADNKRVWIASNDPSVSTYVNGGPVLWGKRDTTQKYIWLEDSSSVSISPAIWFNTYDGTNRGLASIIVYVDSDGTSDHSFNINIRTKTPGRVSNRKLLRVANYDLTKFEIDASGNVYVYGDILPTTDNVYDLGSKEKKFAEVFGRVLKTDAIYSTYWDTKYKQNFVYTIGVYGDSWDDEYNNTYLKHTFLRFRKGGAGGNAGILFSNYDTYTTRVIQSGQYLMFHGYPTYDDAKSGTNGKVFLALNQDTGKVLVYNGLRFVSSAGAWTVAYLTQSQNSSDKYLDIIIDGVLAWRFRKGASGGGGTNSHLDSNLVPLHNHTQDLGNYNYNWREVHAQYYITYNPSGDDPKIYASSQWREQLIYERLSLMKETQTGVLRRGLTIDFAVNPDIDGDDNVSLFLVEDKNGDYGGGMAYLGKKEKANFPILGHDFTNESFVENDVLVIYTMSNGTLYPHIRMRRADRHTYFAGDIVVINGRMVGYAVKREYATYYRYTNASGVSVSWTDYGSISVASTSTYPGSVDLFFRAITTGYVEKVYARTSGSSGGYLYVYKNGSLIVDGASLDTWVTVGTTITETDVMSFKVHLTVDSGDTAYVYNVVTQVKTEFV